MKNLHKLTALGVCLISAMGAHAASDAVSVIIIGTRVVYPSDARDVNIRLNNNGELPAMVQAWLDTGSAEAAPETIDVPFRLTPSLFRIDPSKNQSLRLVYAPESADKALPLNKESLFWLNVLEVPPRPVTAKDQNYLQFAVRSRIKLFFRPKDLPGSAATAQESLKWQVKREGNVLRLTDFHLDGRVSGYDLIIRLRQLQKTEIPSILLTGDVDIRHAIVGPAQNVVIAYKPLPNRKLAMLIHEATTATVARCRRTPPEGSPETTKPSFPRASMTSKCLI